MSLRYDPNELPQPKTSKSSTSTRVRWDTLDKEQYQQLVKEGVYDLVQSTEAVDNHEVDVKVEQLCDLLRRSALATSKPRRRPKSQPRLKVWNQEIRQAYSVSKKAFSRWKAAGKPQDNHDLLKERMLTKRHFRATYRQALARRDEQFKQKINDCRSRDVKFFHRLVNMQRKKGQSFVTDLHVGEIHYTDGVLDGFREHFESLGRPSTNSLFDNDYHAMVLHECSLIEATLSERPCQQVTPKELDRALASLNKGKAPDIHELTVEHILFCKEVVHGFLLDIVNSIFASGQFPTILKQGLVSPIFKNKGQANNASNYRGITVLPVVGKVIEAILRQRIAPQVDSTQNKAQRGFSKGSSPANAAFIVEELYREYKDNKTDLNLVLLDARSAFDVVDHSHLLRRLNHIGVPDKLWSLIRSFHEDSTSCIKWQSQISDSFPVNQGVRQGGVLSTDLYKVYVNPLLNRLQSNGIGSRIGEVCCAASACADDICLCAGSDTEIQELVNISAEFANMERYLLHPHKSVHIKVSAKRKKTSQAPLTMNNTQLPSVTSATHLGIIRTESIKRNHKENTEENLRKARRKAYSLFGSGYRGHGGLNAKTIIHLYIVYILPVLLYGMEIILPSATWVKKLEGFQRKFVKEILQTPQNTASIAVHFLTGLLPVEALIHLRALQLLHNMCSLDTDSIEANIIRRQLQLKSVESNSWVIEVRKLFWRYNLGSIDDFVHNPPSKSAWRTFIYREVNSFYTQSIQSQVTLYSSLTFLRHDIFLPGKLMPMLAVEYSARESNRLRTKIRLLTGTYLLQSTRQKFNQHEVDPTCQMCNSEPETVHHFILTCPALDSVRATAMADVEHQWANINGASFKDLPTDAKLQAIINGWPLLAQRLKSYTNPEFHEYEKHCGRLLYSLDQARLFMLLGLARGTPTRTRQLRAR